MIPARGGREDCPPRSPPKAISTAGWGREALQTGSCVVIMRSMAVAVRILDRYNLVYVKYGVIASPSAALTLFESYTSDDRYQPLQHHLVDLSAVEDYERNYPAMMQLFARLMDAAPPARAAPVLGMYAPSPIAAEFAHFAIAALRDTDRLVVLINDAEDRLLESMGLAPRSIAELLKNGVDDARVTAPKGPVR